MKKEIILLVVFGLFIALFIPDAYVSADSVFIGVTIDSAVRSDGVSPFCLPNSTTVSILDSGGTLIAGSAHASESTACAGQTLWSNLVALTSNSDYSVKLDAPGCYAPVFFNIPWQLPGSSTWHYEYDALYAPNNNSTLYPTSTSDDQNPASNFYAFVPNGGAIIDTRSGHTGSTGNPICWIQGDYGESCTAACATAGLATDGNCEHYDLNCEKTLYFLSWKVILACQNAAAYPNYSTTYGYRDGSNNTSSNTCGSSSGSMYRLCQCSYSINSFSFPFTPVF
ncbi:MAG: hypothetical protein LiPW30_750 [Parcubacteria group bacterium LiPW_30]|nr:MAG: hypothetical protein LiPW30_750 [Parcubacteria group bacterium LiPW_30]